MDHELTQRRLSREMKARKEAESLIEKKSLELYELNQQLTNYTERLKHSNNDLQHFAHTVSHDLKAPLNRLMMLLELIQLESKEAIKNSELDYLSIMKDQIGHMDELITSVLEYSKLDSNNIKNELVDLNTLLKEVIAQLPGTEGFDIRYMSLPSLKANRTQVKQVFQNLIGNAIKYHHKGQGSIEITHITYGLYHKLTVSDDGPGIDPRYHEQIFDLFGTTPDNQREDSTGVGLAIVKKIINQNRGKIWVESAPGNGTQFIFHWPT